MSAEISAAPVEATDARLTPQSLDAERSVLGGILLSNEQLYEVVELLQAADFYRSAHRRIFGGMLALSEKGEPIDVITLSEQLKRTGHLEEVGGLAYISSLDAFVPATANLMSYAQIIRDKATLRAVIAAGSVIVREAYEPRVDVEVYLDTVEQRIFDVTERRGEQGFRETGKLVKSAFGRLELLYERQSDVTGLRTGLQLLDSITAGLQLGDLVIVAGRPSMGKTALAMGIAAYVAIELKKVAGVFSMEMSAESLVTRLFASEGRVDGQRLRNGKLLDSDWPKLAKAADRIFHARERLHIDDSAGQSVLQVRAKARKLKATSGLDLVVVDYLQLMTGSSGADNREQVIAEISRGLKALARELSVPVIALSQLNRSLEKREDKRPIMSDLRESGALEQDADVIAFVYRDEVYNKTSPDKGIAEIIVGKQRNGPTGTVRVTFLRDYTRFDNLESF